MASLLPIIPQTITVHLGSPGSPAENVTLPFSEYIANVASSEIYPTWPENAIRANIYAETSFALNRIYTEFYRSRGYAYDITNSTAYDQYFVKGREIFENVRNIALDLFNDYIRRRGNIEPLFAQYCNGTTTTCRGLSQWGTVTLANQGYSPLQILQYYYGNNIELVEDNAVGIMKETAPRVALRLGSVSDKVRTLQIRLNRISSNYPSIPKILVTDGIFGTDTEAAVRRYQQIFSLAVDGIVGKITWYSINNTYIAVKRLNELDAEGIKLGEVTQQYPSVLRQGDVGVGVQNLQYYLNFLSAYTSYIPPVSVDGIFGPKTKSAVEDAQRYYGVTVDGIVGEITWNALYRSYLGIVSTIPPKYTEGVTLPFGGVPLRQGAESDSVRLLQEYLNYVAKTIQIIPSVNPTGYFGSATRRSVIAFQSYYGLEETGVVGPITWQALTETYEAIYQGSKPISSQYPGRILEREV